MRVTLNKNGFTAFDTAAGGYALKKGSSTYGFGSSTLHVGIGYLRPELRVAAQKLQVLLRQWVAIPDQAIYFTDPGRLNNEGSNLYIKDFIRVSGLDIEIEF